MAPFLITWLCLVAIVLGQAPAFYVPVVVGPLDDSSAIETDLSITIDALYMQNKIDHNRIGELIIDRIVLTSDPQQDQQIIGDYLAMHRDVDIAFAVVLTSNPYVPSQFVGVRQFLQNNSFPFFAPPVFVWDLFPLHTNP
jgi:hypothetical protein